ncbi:protein kinase, partial [bacterium]|nr:protein kinase [candidate division CSSED10-310 bacterium]
HRDIKPDNIIITHDGRPVVMDFGIAKALQWSALRSSRVFGTGPYIAPEQLVAGEPDGRSDQYSFGILLYRMLTRRFPFPRHVKQEQLLDYVQRRRIELIPIRTYLPEIDQVLEEIIQRCISFYPQDRFSDMKELIRAARRIEIKEESTQVKAVPAGPEAAVGAAVARAARAFSIQDYQGAVRILENAQALDPDNRRIAELLTRSRKKLDEQLEIEAYMERGSDAYSRGEFNEALRLWRKVLDLDDDHQRARMLIQRTEQEAALKKAGSMSVAPADTDHHEGIDRRHADTALSRHPQWSVDRDSDERLLPQEPGRLVHAPGMADTMNMELAGTGGDEPGSPRVTKTLGGERAPIPGPASRAGHPMVNWWVILLVIAAITAMALSGAGVLRRQARGARTNKKLTVMIPSPALPVALPTTTDYAPASNVYAAPSHAIPRPVLTPAGRIIPAETAIPAVSDRYHASSPSPRLKPPITFPMPQLPISQSLQPPPTPPPFRAAQAAAASHLSAGDAPAALAALRLALEQGCPFHELRKSSGAVAAMMGIELPAASSSIRLLQALTMQVEQRLLSLADQIDTAVTAGRFATAEVLVAEMQSLARSDPRVRRLTTRLNEERDSAASADKEIRTLLDEGNPTAARERLKTVQGRWGEYEPLAATAVELARVEAETNEDTMGPALSDLSCPKRIEQRDAATVTIRAVDESGIGEVRLHVQPGEGKTADIEMQVDDPGVWRADVPASLTKKTGTLLIHITASDVNGNESRLPARGGVTIEVLRPLPLPSLP